MRLADNFNPEWGYLAPAPSFTRTVRVALVAAAVGAISGAGVVLSLIDRPAAEETSIAARTLVLQTDSASAVASAAAQLQGPHEIGTAADHVANPASPRVAESEADPGSPSHGSAAALTPADAPAAATPTPANDAVVAGDMTAKKAVKRQPLPQQRLTWRAPREQSYDPGREAAFGSARTPLALLPKGNNPMRSQYSGAYQPRDDF
jgi:hypothetical protein